MRGSHEFVSYEQLSRACVCACVCVCLCVAWRACVTRGVHVSQSDAVMRCHAQRIKDKLLHVTLQRITYKVVQSIQVLSPSPHHVATRFFAPLCPLGPLEKSLEGGRRKEEGGASSHRQLQLLQLVRSSWSLLTCA